MTLNSHSAFFVLTHNVASAPMPELSRFTLGNFRVETNSNFLNFRTPAL
jgi:hypothetical protein